MFAFNRFFDAFRAFMVVALPTVPLVCISVWGPESIVLENVIIAVCVAAIMVAIVALASMIQGYSQKRAVSSIAERVTSAAQFVGRLDRNSYRRLRPVWAPKLMMGQAAAPLVFLASDVDLQIWIMSPEYLMLSVPWWAVQSVSLTRSRMRSPRVVISGTDPKDPLLPVTVIVPRAGIAQLARSVQAFAAHLDATRAQS